MNFLELRWKLKKQNDGGGVGGWGWGLTIRGYVSKTERLGLSDKNVKNSTEQQQQRKKDQNNIVGKEGRKVSAQPTKHWCQTVRIIGSGINFTSERST